MIERKKIYIPYKKVIKEAHYQDIPTNQLKEISIFDNNGIEKKEQVPIYNKVFIEAVYEEAFLEKEVFSVKVLNEEHQFETEKEARDFLK